MNIGLPRKQKWIFILILFALAQNETNSKPILFLLMQSKIQADRKELPFDKRGDHDAFTL
jgi:hypothetical protein